MTQEFGLNKDLWTGVFYHLLQRDLVACTYVSRSFRVGAQAVLRQRIFVKACTMGDLEKMAYLIQAGVNPALPDDQGNCPLCAVALSLNIKAMRYLDRQLGACGNVVWQRVDLEALRVDLNHLKPYPLIATGGIGPEHYLTHGDLHQCYKANETQCKAYYDYQFGEGRWESMLEALAAFAPGDRANEFYLYEDRELMGGPIVIRWCESIQMAIEHVNKKIEHVVQFVQARVDGDFLCISSQHLAPKVGLCPCAIS